VLGEFVVIKIVIRARMDSGIMIATEFVMDEIICFFCELPFEETFYNQCKMV